MIQEVIDRIAIEMQYPIGTQMHLKSDYPDTVREVFGYEYFSDTGYIIFLDGSKLNMRNLHLIEWSR